MPMKHSRLGNKLGAPGPGPHGRVLVRGVEIPDFGTWETTNLNPPFFAIHIKHEWGCPMFRL